jgi:hypothetical protein
MSRGIAEELLTRRYNFKKELQKQKLQVQDVGIIRDKGRHLYYLVKKEKSYEKPSMENLKATLIMLKKGLIENGEMSVSILLIGCDVDNWMNETS